MVELQMAAEDAELEWEDERRQEKVRKLEAAYDTGSSHKAVSNQSRHARTCVAR